jgi:hypothetical protein
MQSSKIEQITSTLKNKSQSGIAMAKDKLASFQRSPHSFALSVIVELVIIVLVLYKWNPWGVSTVYPVASAISILSFCLVQLMNYMYIIEAADLRSVGQKPDVTLGVFAMKVGATLASIFLAVAVAVLLVYLLSSFPTAATLLTWLVDLLAIAGILGLLYLLLKPVIAAGKSKEGRASLLSLVGKMVLYVPCLLIAFADWVKEQHNLTTKTTWILLLIEAAIIALRFALPYLIRKAQNIGGTQLLTRPVYLNKPTTVGTFKELHGDGERNYTYSISCWFRINPQPPNTRAAYNEYANVISYGGQPAVEYKGVDNSLRVTYKIDDDRTVTVYENKSPPLQRWNYLVLNFDKGNMDVFINNKLVASQPGVAPYMSFESITLGQDRGIEGGICNVSFSKNIVGLDAMKLAYNTLGRMSTPVV